MAQDQSWKRRRIAEKAVVAAGALDDVLLTLQELAAQRAQLPDFTQAELDDITEGFDLRHLTPYLLGVLLDIVTPSFAACYEDAANAGRNKNILRQVRR